MQSSVFDTETLHAAFAAAGVKAIHATAVWSAVLRGCRDLAAIEGLPKEAREVLEGFLPLVSRVVDSRTSADGTTTKLIVQVPRASSAPLKVECVLMRHDASAGKYAGGPRQGGHRTTLCVSSQAGCQMGCTFCATGTMGLLGNLKSGEIVEQLVHALVLEPVIRNVTFMGQGEPLNNYSAVLGAIRAMADPRVGLGLSKSRITVSTVGVVPYLAKLASDEPRVNLALSLHAPTQELRLVLVPAAARAHTLAKLMAALASYCQTTGRGAFVEYVLLSGVNDGDDDARALGELLSGLPSLRAALLPPSGGGGDTGDGDDDLDSLPPSEYGDAPAGGGLSRSHTTSVNLIPFNASAAVPHYTAPSPARVTAFQVIVRGEFGIRCTVRQAMGQDVWGACGQLALAHADGRGAPPVLADIEDVGGHNS